MLPNFFKLVFIFVIQNVVLIVLSLLFPYKKKLADTLSSQSKEEFDNEFLRHYKYDVEKMDEEQANILKEEFYKNELKEKYRILNVLCLFLFIGSIALIVPITYFLYTFIKDAVGSYFNSFSNYKYMIRPSTEFVTIPSVLLASFFSIISPFFVLKLVMSGRFKEYFSYLSWDSGLNVGKIFLFIGSALTVFFLSIIILGADCYTLIQKDEIKINRFYSISTMNYPFSDIKAIYKVKKYRAPNGNILDKPYYMVKFNDGYIWTPRDYLVEWEPKDKEYEIFNYLSSVSKKGIREVEFRENI